MDEDVIDLTPEKAAKGARVKEQTPLDRLREKLAEKIERPEKLIEVPERKGLFLKFSPNVTQAEMRAWRKKAGEGTKSDFDLTKFSTIVIASTCRGIFMEGKELFNEDGYPLTFASPEIKDMLDVERPWPEGVRAMFGNDAHVDQAAMAILEAAGFGESVEVTDEDPLKNS